MDAPPDALIDSIYPSCMVRFAAVAAVLLATSCGDPEPAPAGPPAESGTPCPAVYVEGAWVCLPG